jgi:hypothetical protein
VTVEELAAYIYEDRREAMASGEGGLVAPPELDAKDLLVLEEWALMQARKHKTLEAYVAAQATALGVLREKVRAREVEVLTESAREGERQGLEILSLAAAQARVRKLWN